MMSKKSQRGIALIWVIIAGTLLIAGVGAVVSTPTSTPTPKQVSKNEEDLTQQEPLLIPDVENSNQPPECRVKSIVKLGEGSFPKWSPDGSLIAFNKLVNNVYEIFTMKPDGSDVNCLTCDKTQLPPSGHKGQPYWHPNGEYLVFTVQNTDHKLVREGYVEQADAGRNHNVWPRTWLESGWKTNRRQLRHQLAALRKRPIILF